MPTYSYKCPDCQHKFDVFQSMKDDPIKECPECEGQKVTRLIGSGAGIVFKGSGFYVTDYKKSSASGDNKSAETGKTETKSETTTSKSEVSTKSN